MEGDFTTQGEIPDAFTSAVPARVVACEWVPDAYLALQKAQEAGKIRLKSYAENSEKTLHWLAKTIRQEYDTSGDTPDYRRFLLDKFTEFCI